jgi:hypothetical protein
VRPEQVQLVRPELALELALELARRVQLVRPELALELARRVQLELAQAQDVRPRLTQSRRNARPVESTPRQHEPHNHKLP